VSGFDLFSADDAGGDADYGDQDYDDDDDR
jgi:hypothetical protein